MKKILRAFLDAVRSDICFRTADCQEQIRFILNRSEQIFRISEAVDANEIPLRVTHNDPHYKNILTDSVTGKAICLIDLDTVMPGVSILDFGEAVRVGAATANEEERSGDIELDLDLYQGILRGYDEEMGRVLTEKEWGLISYAVWLATFEHVIRDLTEYLEGDQNAVDFSEERQNLYRAVNQSYLLLDIEEKIGEIDAITEEVRRRH